MNVEFFCYLEVEEDNKIDPTSHVISTMRPRNIIVVANDMKSECGRLFDLFEDCKIKDNKIDEYVKFYLTVRHRILHKVSNKVLRIVLYTTLADELILNDAYGDHAFTMFLSISTERSIVSKLKLQKLSPTSFISFHQCK